MVLLVLIVWLAYTTQAISGFGSTVVSVTLAALFMPVSQILPIAVALNLPFCGWLIYREYPHIDFILLRRKILPLMLCGLLLGAVLSLRWQDVDISRPLGALILVCTVLDLWRLQQVNSRPPSTAVRSILLLVSGCAQGFAASGGPLLAVALVGSGHGKQVIRASLSVVWLITNTILTLSFLLSDRYSQAMQYQTLAFFPVVVLALWTGEYLHHKVNERQFRYLVDLLLLVSAIALLI